MIRFSAPFFFIILLSFSVFPLFSQQIEVEFEASSRFGKVKGKFSNPRLELTAKQKGSRVEVDINTLETGNRMRDNHLKEEDFLNSKEFPKAIFILESLEPKDEIHLRAKGNLTIRNITKEVSFLVQKTENLKKMQGELEINRFDFNVKYDGWVNPISEKVLIKFTITLE
jgi:polyisoprenoid-binding protein YceI